MFRLVLAMAIATAGCSDGFPLAHTQDPQADVTAKDAAPLVGQCRDRFRAALAGAGASFDSGPSIERDGAFTRITLEAQPADPDALHPFRFECRFESGGLVAAVMLP
jgi:hypothetical protein